jgi:hypothetical protein
MDLILILLIILLFIVIYMNYNKIINNNDVNNDVNKENKKKVKWCENNLIMAHHLHPEIEIDYFDQYNNGLDGLPLSNKNINSNVTKYLDKMKNSYSSTVCDTYPKKASIPVAPDCINEIDARTIINTHVTNDRVLDYKQSLDNKCQENNMYDGEDIGNVYDNLVDNFRIKWGKIDSLNGNEKHDHYILENKPNEMGYTSFATY